MPIFKKTDIHQTPETNDDPIHIDTSTVYLEPSASNAAEGQATITEIEGTPWSIKAWYGQILGEDDYPNRFDHALDPTLQQYLKINDYVIKVTESLDGDTDDNIITTVIGTANLYPGVIPNQWDMFIAQMKDGRTGVFTVSEQPTRLNYLSTSAFSVTYELVDYLNGTYQAGLDGKVVKELYFDKENPTCSGATTETVDEKGPAMRELRRLYDLYYDMFFDRKTKTFILNKDNSRIYDDNIVRFMNTIVPTELRNGRTAPSSYSTPSVKYEQVSKTVLDVMIDGEMVLWYNVDTKYAKVAVDNFYSSFVMNSIMLSDIGYVYIPESQGSLNGDHEAEANYIFSEAFYDSPESDEHHTKFERLVKETMKRNFKSIDECIEIIDGELDYSDDHKLYHTIPVAIWIYLLKI